MASGDEPAPKREFETRGATFFFRKTAEDYLKPFEGFICSVCFKWFKIEKEAVEFYYDEQPAGSGYPFYGDLKDKLAIVQFFGVPREQVQKHKERLIDAMAQFMKVPRDRIYTILPSKEEGTYKKFCEVVGNVHSEQLPLFARVSSLHEERHMGITSPSSSRTLAGYTSSSKHGEDLEPAENYLKASGASEWITLLVKSTGQAVELKARPSDTIASLKSQLQSNEEATSWDQLLVHKGKRMKDATTVVNAGLSDGAELQLVLCPRGLTSMGSDMGELFVKALSEKAVHVIRVKLVIVGKDRVGKTSFKRSLLKQKFNKDEPSTGMVKAELAVCEASNWTEIKDKIKDMIDQHIAGAVMQKSQTGSTIETPTTADESTTKDNSTAESRPEITFASAVEASGISTKHLETATALSKAILDKMKLLQGNPEQMNEDESVIHITVWDLGGQEPLLPCQTQVITPGSFFLIVFKASDPLGDAAQSSFRPSADSPEIPIQNSWIKINYDAVALWAATVSLARDEHQQDTNPYIDPLPGEQIACLPLMFLVGTHAKDVTHEMKIKQNKFLSEQFKGKAFVKHMITPSNHEDDWFFCVENSVSDPDGSEECPSVVKIKKCIEEQAIRCKRLIPAKWSVLEKILASLQKKLGSALSQFDVIWVLAKELCHMSEKKELRAALCYLDEVGSVIFPYRNEKLRNTVVTKPDWLFMVFSVISSLNRPYPIYTDDWNRVRQKGIMSWRLTSHRLDQANVRKPEYSDVLNLLNCFYILCANPHPASQLLPANPYETEYFVPCLLESVDSLESCAANMPPNVCRPMSLIVCARAVGFIPEVIYFRLMTCCIEKYSKDPFLKRNFSKYRVTKGVNFELIYDSNKYIIISIDRKKSYCRDIGLLCRNILQFIRDKLNEVKKNGFCGLQFNWYIQHGRSAVPVDPTKLVCIDGYESDPDMPLRNLEGPLPIDIELEDDEMTTLNFWFDDLSENQWHGDSTDCDNGRESAPKQPQLMSDDFKFERLVKPPEQLFSSTAVCNGEKEETGGTRSSIVTGEDDVIMQPDPGPNVALSTSEGIQAPDADQYVATSNSVMNAIVTEAQIQIVSQAAGSKWHEIGVHLGLKTEQLRFYETSEPKDSRKRLFSLLEDWVQRVDRPTVGALVLACEQAQVGGVVKRSLGLIKEEQDSNSEIS